MRQIILLSLCGLCLASPNDLNPQSVFGGQWSQGLSYSNNLTQTQIPYLSYQGDFEWFEPFCLRSAHSPWQSPYLQAGAQYQISPFDFNYQMNLGLKFMGHLALRGQYTQNHYFATTQDVPWNMDQSLVAQQWNAASEIQNLHYQDFTLSRAYQSFGLSVIAHGNLPKSWTQGSWKLSAEHVFIDRRNGTEDRLYDYSIHMPLAKNDEILNLIAQTEFQLNSQFSLSLSHQRIISLLQSGVLSQGDLFDPKHKPSLHLNSTFAQLKWQTQQQWLDLGLGMELHNEEWGDWKHSMQMRLGWTKSWQWPLSAE